MDIETELMELAMTTFAISAVGSFAFLAWAVDLLPVCSYRKVGGIHFWRVGRLGGSFYVARR